MPRLALPAIISVLVAAILSPVRIEPFKDIDIRQFAKVLSKATTYAQ